MLILPKHSIDKKSTFLHVLPNAYAILKSDDFKNTIFKTQLLKSHSQTCPYFSSIKKKKKKKKLNIIYIYIYIFSITLKITLISLHFIGVIWSYLLVFGLALTY
jgi:hypothetical protein